MKEAFTKCPKASKLIAALQTLIEKHGDLPICVLDADTEWLLEIGLQYKPEDPYTQSHIEITSDYHELPEGYVEP